MSVARLGALLERRHGLRWDGVTRTRLQRELDAGAQRTGLALDDYADTVVLDVELQRAIVDRVTLPESSFFRDPPLFEALRDTVLPEALARGGTGTLRVWSAGCAHGQEPYSVAMLLSELGVPRFEVIATDLSGAACARAAAGVFAERELRGLSAPRRARFLRPHPGGFVVEPGLRSRVRVLRHDLASDPPPVEAGLGCDVVLCRYVLIYLTPGAARDVLGRVAGVLRPGGRLAIGAAESLWHLSDAFVPAPAGGAVLYQERPVAERRGSGSGAATTAASPAVRDDGARGAARSIGTSTRSRDAGARPRHAGRRTPDVGAPDWDEGTRAQDATTRAQGADARAQSADTRAYGADARAQAADTRARGADGRAPGPAQWAAGAGAAARPDPEADDLVRAGEAAAAAGDLPAAIEAFRGAVYLRPEDVLASVGLGLALEASGDPGAGRAFRAAWAALARTNPTALQAGLGGYRAEALVHLIAGKLDPGPER